MRPGVPRQGVPRGSDRGKRLKLVPRRRVLPSTFLGGRAYGISPLWGADPLAVNPMARWLSAWGGRIKSIRFAHRPRMNCWIDVDVRGSDASHDGSKRLACEGKPLPNDPPAD